MQPQVLAPFPRPVLPDAHVMNNEQLRNIVNSFPEGPVPMNHPGQLPGPDIYNFGGELGALNGRNQPVNPFIVYGQQGAGAQGNMMQQPQAGQHQPYVGRNDFQIDLQRELDAINVENLPYPNRPYNQFPHNLAPPPGLFKR